MKRRVFCLLCALALTVGLTGCAPEVPPESPSPAPAEEALYVDLVQAPADFAPLTVYRTASIPESPAAELGLSSVALYTSARQGENGAFEWDDGQSFSLIVTAEDGHYPLISDLYLQFGAVDYLTFSEEEGGVFHALVQITEGVGVQIRDYRYDAGGRRFVGTSVYEAGPLDWVQAPLEAEGRISHPPAGW